MAWGLSWAPEALPPGRLAAFLEHLRGAGVEAGTLRVAKESGLFIATCD
ncbi:MAG: hypothetical protein AB1505_17185 [Candidatus Latescibacterota bacterium]